LIVVEDEKDIFEAIGFGRNSGHFFILGGGTNVLFGDSDYRGTIIKIALKDIKDREDGLFVSSGVLMADLLNFCLIRGLSGLEWAGGLPGTVGGAIRGNAGAFGKETKDCILGVESVDRNNYRSNKVVRSNKECRFGYRDSVFKHNDEIILGVVFRLVNRNKEEIEKEMNERILYRKTHQPLEYPSAGSTFKNIPLDSVSEKVAEEFRTVVKTDPFPVIPVAAVLDKLDLKGKMIGGAEISEKHPNFFINKNNASFADVIGLIDLAKQRALEKYGIVLVEEIEIIN